MSVNKNGIDNNIIYFLSLVKEGLHDFDYEKNDEKIKNSKLDWDYIYKIAVRNNLLGIIYPVISGEKDKNGIPPTLLDMWNKRTKEYIFWESKKYMAIRRILNEAEKEGIKLVLFKGCVLADLYPQYMLRYSSDTDIFVYEKDKEKAAKLLESLGYIKNNQQSKEQVWVYVLNNPFHIIELHFRLWEDYTGRKIDIMAEMNLTSEDNLIEVNACDMKVFTLGYEEHLIYQMFHIIKHFSTEAVGVRYLADITLFVNRFGDLIDFKHFWEQINRLGFAKFCYTFFKLCIRYFDMKADIILEVSFTDINSEDVLLLDILNRGLLFEDKTSSWQILGIMTPYLVGEETIPDTRLRRKLKVLFPSSKALPKKLSYAKRHRILLPIAWIHKMVDFSIRYRKYNKIYGDWYNAGQKLTTADYRLNLMKNLGLVENEQ